MYNNGVVTIEGGCTELGEGLWRYDWTTNDGPCCVIFNAGPLKPKIGDTVASGVLIPLEGYKINSDTSRWRPSDYDEWPE